MTDIEQEARAAAGGARRALPYSLNHFTAGYIAGASRPASPASREAVARLLCEAEDSGTYSEDEGTCTWHFELADALLAAFTITEKGAE